MLTPKSSNKEFPVHKAINPDTFGKTISLRTIGSSVAYSDNPVVSIVKIRPIKDPSNKALDISVDVAGCNFRCAHCWVSNASLSANFRDPAMQKKLDSLPKPFRKNPVDALALAEYLAERLKKTAGQFEGSGISFSGGEPLPYRGGIRTIGEYIQKRPEPFYVNMETTGYLIAQDEKYLDAFEGLQDTLRFYVSIKNMDPASFARFTGVDGAHHEDAFIALERLYKRGFLATPGGIVLNTFEDEKNLGKPDNAIEKLHARLSRIHPDLPRALAYHSVTFGQVQAPEEQKKRFDSRGYGDTSPGAVRKALTSHFAAQGTPVIMADNDTKVKGLEYKRTEGVLKKVIRDLRRA